MCFRDKQYIIATHSALACSRVLSSRTGSVWGWGWEVSRPKHRSHSSPVFSYPGRLELRECENQVPIVKT